MDYAYCGLGLVDMLTARAARTVGLKFKVGGVYLNIDLLDLGEYGYSYCRGVYSALRLGLRYTLYAVYAAFVFQLAVCALSLYRKADFLVAAEFGGISVYYLYLPAL